VLSLREVLRVSSLVLHLYSHEESRFMVRIEQGGEDIDLGEEIFEDVIEKGRSRLLNDLGAENRYPALAGQGFRSLVVAPLTRIKRGGQKESIGLVAALSREQRDFTSHDLHLLSAFARQAGLIIENAQLYERTQELAVRDGMTNLYNYRHFKEMLETELAHAGAGGRPLALLMVDIDYFKRFNDTHGHQRGDAVLRTTAEILMRFTRGADVVARYGGDEFVVILPDTGRVGARSVGENIRRRVEEQSFPGQEESQPGGTLTTTLGLAVYPEDGRDAAKLIQAADRALYAGKESGRGRLVSADEVPPPKEE
jgi:diguanylate cyclase (GGDEF)-like protein